MDKMKQDIQMPVMPKEAAYGLVEQFRTLGKRVAFPGHTVWKNREKGYTEFVLRNPWYTSLPVSCVEDIRLVINDTEIPAEQVEFVIREQAIPFLYARNLYEMIWTMGETAVIRTYSPEAFSVIHDGGEVHLQLEFEIRTPFEGYQMPNNHIRYLFDEQMVCTAVPEGRVCGS